MKKILLSVVMFIAAFSTAHAQFDVGNLNGGVGLGYVRPVGDFSEYAKGGLSYHLLLGYRLTDEIDVGLDLGRAFTSAISDLPGGGGTLDLYGYDNVYLRGLYRFIDADVVPYAGAALGVVRITEPNYGFIGAEGRTTNFGAKAELGVVIGSFNISYSFNYNGKTPRAVYNNADQLTVFHHNFRLGYIYNFIW